MVVLLCQVSSGFSAIGGNAHRLIQDEPSARPGLERFVNAADVPSYGHAPRLIQDETPQRPSQERIVYAAAVPSYGNAPRLIQDEPSARPGLERFVYAADIPSYGTYHRHIILDDFGVGSAVGAYYVAPNKGRVSLNLIDEAEENIVLHVDARYRWSSAVDSLVLNTYEAGVGWGSEEKPDGFDFTPGILVTVHVVAEADSFTIFCNGLLIGHYEYRLPVTSVKKLQVVFEDNNAEQQAEFKSLYVYFG